jgi:hypothetical protein
MYAPLSEMAEAPPNRTAKGAKSDGPVRPAFEAFACAGAVKPA